MAYATKYGNYVKFLRGTPAAWQTVDNKDEDTIYFISEEGADRGQLFLGSKLIADGNSVALLKDLEDISVSESIADNSLLVFDYSSKKWINKTLQEVMSIVVDIMEGATADKNGVAGLVPPPLAGQEDLFLQASGSWKNPTEQVEKDLDTLEDTVEQNAKEWKEALSNLRGGETGTIVEIATDAANEAVAKLVANAPEEFDTLKEIAEWIEKYPSQTNIADIILKVNNHETILNGTDGLVTKVGSLDTAINDPATGLLARFSTIQGSMNTLIADVSDLKTDNTNNKNAISELQKALKWQLWYEETETAG